MRPHSLRRTSKASLDERKKYRTSVRLVFIMQSIQDMSFHNILPRIVSQGEGKENQVVNISTFTTLDFFLSAQGRKKNS